MLDERDKNIYKVFTCKYSSELLLIFSSMNKKPNEAINEAMDFVRNTYRLEIISMIAYPALWEMKEK